MTATIAHRYAAVPTDDGFILDGGAGRPPVHVRLFPTCWRVEVDDGTPASPPPRTFGLFEVRKMIDCATTWSMVHWRGRATTTTGPPGRPPGCWGPGGGPSRGTPRPLRIRTAPVKSCSNLHPTSVTGRQNGRTGRRSAP